MARCRTKCRECGHCGAKQVVFFGIVKTIFGFHSLVQGFFSFSKIFGGIFVGFPPRDPQASLLKSKRRNFR